MNSHRKEETGLFIIYKLDIEIKKRRREVLNEDTLEFRELVYGRLPKQYHSLMNLYSKKESDKLPPHRAFDHKITILQDPDVKYSLLYKISTSELETIRQYLTENLQKGFITPNDSPFASLVLFIKKTNGSLRFYVDYRRLNAISKKDRYPLSCLTTQWS